jgi:hypothetical protein
MKNYLKLLLYLFPAIFFSVPVSAQKAEKSGLCALIEGVAKGDIYKDLLLSGKPILCSDPKIDIIYFTLSVFHKNGDLIVFNGQGNMLTESMKAEIRSLEGGSKLIIENIGAKTPGDKIIHLPTVHLVVRQR